MNRICLAAALLCVLTFSAEARQRPITADPGCNILWPCEGIPSARAFATKVGKNIPNSIPDRAFYSISKPVRYIAGRLVCAINLNAALAERGIRGTGSALAHSFDRWGLRTFTPVPGAVAVTDRRGGGHVALVALVKGSRVFVWNPSPRGRGWQLREYTSRHARYRVAG